MSPFRYEEADTCKPANGMGEGGREGLREFISHLSPESPRLRWPARLEPLGPELEA